MKRSEYMTRKEIQEENKQKLVEWGAAVKSGLIVVVAFLLGVAAVDIILVAICMLFRVW